MDRHHNSPPLAERLEIDYADLVQRTSNALALVPGELRLIETDEEAGEYAETAKAIKDVAAAVEKARKGEKDEALKMGRAIDGYFAKMGEPLTALVNKIVGAINTFQRAKLEAERRQREEEERRARQEAAVFDEPPPPIAAPILVKEAARVTSISGTKATASRKWVHEVTDANAVPRQYLMVNDAALKAAIAGGARAIPGVRIFEDVRTAIR